MNLVRSRHGLLLGFLGLSSIALGAAACDGGDPDTPGRGGATESGITGSLLDTFVHGGQEVTQPRSNVTVSALVPGEGDQFTSFDATVTDDGTFRIPDAPEGEVYLAVESTNEPPRFIVSSKRTFDLGRLYTNRPDVTPVTSPTEVTLNATGLSAWQDIDFMEMYSPGAGTWGFLAGLSSGFPAPGAVSLTGATLDTLEFIVPNLIEGSKGDEAFITQLVGTTVGSLEYRGLRKVLKAAPFTQVNGQPTTITGTFEDVPQEPHSVDWQLSQFQALAAEVHPQASVSSHSFSVYADPIAPARISYSGTPTLADGYTTDSADVTFDVPYGNPLQGSGALIAGATLCSFQVTLPGFPQPKGISGSIVTLAARDAWTSVSLAPVVGPVKDVKLNGSPVADVLTGVGTTPTLTWSAPALGTPSVYRLSVRKLQVEGSASTVAILYTDGTQIRIPPGVLQSGSYYYLRIAGDMNEDVTKPFHSAPEGGYAEALTNAFTP